MEDKRKLAMNYIKCNLADYFNYNNFNLLLASLEVQKANKAFSGLKGKNSNAECLFLLSFLSNLEYDLFEIDAFQRTQRLIPSEGRHLLSLRNATYTVPCLPSFEISDLLFLFLEVFIQCL